MADRSTHGGYRTCILAAPSQPPTMQYDVRAAPSPPPSTLARKHAIVKAYITFASALRSCSFVSREYLPARSRG
jgi:hypothetical protein